MKKNLLLSGLGGSLFPYLHNKLVENFNLYYLDSDINLKLLYPKLNFYPAPLVTSPIYFDLVKNIIKEKHIDFYIPLIDEEIVKGKQLEESEGVKVISPTIEFSDLSLNKSKLMHALHEFGISTIISSTGDQLKEINFPVFVKPVYGRGSRGVRKINNLNELEAYYLLENYHPEDILIQELIVGIEYTVGVTINNLNNILEISTKKIIRKRGITIIAKTERNELITKLVEQVVAQFRPCGPINIQLYLTVTGEIKIFEINPRFSTTTIMSYAAGIDVISLYCDTYNKSFAGSPVQPQDGLILHRRWENIFYEE